MHCRIGVALCQPGHFARIGGPKLGRSGSSQGIGGWPGLQRRATRDGRPSGASTWVSRPSSRRQVPSGPSHWRTRAHVLVDLDFSHQGVQIAPDTYVAKAIHETLVTRIRLAQKRSCSALIRGLPASSSATGIPSNRQHTRAIAGAFAAVTQKPGRTAAARSVKNCTLSHRASSSTTRS